LFASFALLIFVSFPFSSLLCSSCLHILLRVIPNPVTTTYTYTLCSIPPPPTFHSGCSSNQPISSAWVWMHAGLRLLFLCNRECRNLRCKYYGRATRSCQKWMAGKGHRRCGTIYM
jgi:hypothetical protein